MYSTKNLVESVKSKLVSRCPFFGAGALNAPYVDDLSIKTAATDGQTIWVNPKHMAALAPEHRIFVVAHEVGHPLLGHNFRFKGRDPELFNKAADQVLNEQLIKHAGLVPPPGVFYDPKYDGMSLDQVYAIMAADKRKQQKQQQQNQSQSQSQCKNGKSQGQSGKPGDQSDKNGQNKPQNQSQSQSQGQNSQGQGQGQPQNGQGQAQQGGSGAPGGQPGQGQSQPGGQPGNQPGQGGGQSGQNGSAPTPEWSQELQNCPTGYMVPSPEKKPGLKSESDWKIVANQAKSIAKAAGNMPGSTARALKEAQETSVKWFEEVEEFIVSSIATKKTWNTVNKRLFPLGFVLPGQKKDALGEVVFVLDTSGSLDDYELGLVAPEVNALFIEHQPEKLTVIYCDTAVRGVQTFIPGEDFEVVLEPKGNGGTRFNPAFKWIEENCDTPPDVVIFYTDLENGAEVLKEPEEYPVLWMTSDKTRRKAPFGRTIRVKDPA